MDDEEKLLCSTVGQSRSPKRSASRLGASARTYLNAKGPQLKKNAIVVDTWRQILPHELHRHCSLTGIYGGTLQLEVEPGPYMHEMRLVKSELLEHLQDHCRRAGIKRIVLFPKKAGRQSKVEQVNERP
jgi:hypothetical protein